MTDETRPLTAKTAAPAVTETADLRAANRTLETYIIRCGDPAMGKPTWQEAMAALDLLRDALAGTSDTEEET